MSQSRKKDQERIYVRWFLEKMDLASETLRCGERPDFTWNENGDLIGIEVTNLYRDAGASDAGSMLKRGESLRVKWLRELARQHYANGGKPIQVSVSVMGNCDADALQLAPFLTALSNTRLRSVWEEAEYIVELPNGVRCLVDALRVPDDIQFAQYSRWNFLNDEVGFVGTLSPELVSEAVRVKHAKVDDYLKQCDRVWLLIVADRFRNSGRFDFTRGVPSVDIGKFEQIWVADFPLVLHPVSPRTLD